MLWFISHFYFWCSNNISFFNFGLMMLFLIISKVVSKSTFGYSSSRSISSHCSLCSSFCWTEEISLLVPNSTSYSSFSSFSASNPKSNIPGVSMIDLYFCSSWDYSNMSELKMLLFSPFWGNILLESGLISERLNEMALLRDISKWNSLFSGLLGFGGFGFSHVLRSFGFG